MRIKLLLATILVLLISTTLFTIVASAIPSQPKASSTNVNNRRGRSRSAKKRRKRKSRRPAISTSAADTQSISGSGASPTPTPAQPKPSPPRPPVNGPNPIDRGGPSEAKARERATEQASKAARVFEEIMDSHERSIPRDLLDKAEAIAVFPAVLKSGALIGGRDGSGVISRRLPNGWSDPAFFNLSSGSIGLQIGVASTDYVLLFMNKNVVESLLSDRFEIGGENSASAGPVGRSASASTDARLNAQILSYSRSRGAFAGLELKGVVIKADDRLNMPVYGRKASDVLSEANKVRFADLYVELTPGVRVFPNTLEKYSLRR